MGENFDLKITAQSLEKLRLKQITIDDFLAETFNGDEGKNYVQMCAALKAYHHQNGGAPEVLAFEIERLKFNPDTLTGSFGCKFKVSFFFGCDDLHIDKNDTISWQFKINAEARSMHFIGEEPWNSDGN
jgi:hypothetical protein